MSVISTVTNKVDGSIAVGYSPFDIGVNTISHTVYVGNDGGSGPSTDYVGTVSVIRGTSVDATVNVEGTPGGIGVDSLTNNVYVAVSDNDEEKPAKWLWSTALTGLSPKFPCRRPTLRGSRLTRKRTPCSFPTATRAGPSDRFP